MNTVGKYEPDFLDIPTEAVDVTPSHEPESGSASLDTLSRSDIVAQNTVVKTEPESVSPDTTEMDCVTPPHERYVEMRDLTSMEVCICCLL